MSKSKGPFEINLGCPECGGLEWAVGSDGAYECVCCGCNCTFDEMKPQVFEA